MHRPKVCVCVWVSAGVCARVCVRVRERFYQTWDRWKQRNCGGAAGKLPEVKCCFVLTSNLHIRLEAPLDVTFSLIY